MPQDWVESQPPVALCMRLSFCFCACLVSKEGLYIEMKAKKSLSPIPSGGALAGSISGATVGPKRR